MISLMIVDTRVEAEEEPEDVDAEDSDDDGIPDDEDDDDDNDGKFSKKFCNDFVKVIEIFSKT